MIEIDFLLSIGFKHNGYPDMYNSRYTVLVKDNIRITHWEGYKLFGYHSYGVNYRSVGFDLILDKLKIDASDLDPQTYILLIIHEGKSIYNQKLVIQ